MTARISLLLLLFPTLLRAQFDPKANVYSEGHDGCFVTGDHVRLRESPSLEGKVTHYLALGTWVRPMGKAGKPQVVEGKSYDWHRVRIYMRSEEGDLDSLGGWVFGQFLSAVTPQEGALGVFYDEVMPKWKAVPDLVKQPFYCAPAKADENPPCEYDRGIDGETNKTLAFFPGWLRWIGYESSHYEVVGRVVVKGGGQYSLGLKQAFSFELDWFGSSWPAPCPAGMHPCGAEDMFDFSFSNGKVIQYSVPWDDGNGKLHKLTRRAAY